MTLYVLHACAYLHILFKKIVNNFFIYYFYNWEKNTQPKLFKQRNLSLILFTYSGNVSWVLLSTRHLGCLLASPIEDQVECHLKLAISL